MLEPAELIPNWEHLQRLRRTSETQIRLAEAYALSGESEKAEEAFAVASRMTPTLVLPRYRLFEFYLQTDQPDRAYEVARDMVRMKEKVTSSVTIRAKAEARRFIDEYEAKNGSMRD